MEKIRLILLFALVLIAFSLYSCDEVCDHSYETVTVEATCTTDGKITSVCKDCGDKIESVIPLKGHSFTFSVIQADCTTAGYTKYTCECGFSYKSAISTPKGHNYAAEITYPTCSESGYTTYKCKNCSDSYVSDVVAPIGHDLTRTVVAPTCTSQGYTDYSCSACVYSYTSDYVKPLGHSTQPSITSPTCTEMGFTSYVCSVCAFEFISDFTEPTGHNYESDLIWMVSCTRRGEEKFTCDCGATYTVYTAPTGHRFEAVVVHPTVSDMGYTEYICDCGFNYFGNYCFYEEILDNAYANNDRVLAHGIDISSYNHTVNSNGEYEPIDWVALKEAGVDYVILKIGSTPRDNGIRGGIDPTFEMDYAGAKAAGIDVGVYFFTYSTTVEGIRKDAEWLLTYLDGKQFEYPIYLDLEPSENENYHPENIASPILTEMLLTFFSTLQREGYYTGLYVNNEFLFNILQTDNIIELFEVWYARPPHLDSYIWNPEDTESFVWNTEKYGEHLGMWQYCWTGKLPPITTDVDFNYSYKDYPTLIKEYGFNGFAKADSALTSK